MRIGHEGEDDQNKDTNKSRHAPTNNNVDLFLDQPLEFGRGKNRYISIFISPVKMSYFNFQLILISISFQQLNIIACWIYGPVNIKIKELVFRYKRGIPTQKT